MVISQFRAVARKLVAVAFEGFLFVLPHVEAIVRLRIPLFQVANDKPRKPVSPALTRPSISSPMPLLIPAWATPVLVSRLPENAAVHPRIYGFITTHLRFHNN